MELCNCVILQCEWFCNQPRICMRCNINVHNRKQTTPTHSTGACVGVATLSRQPTRAAAEEGGPVWNLQDPCLVGVHDRTNTQHLHCKPSTTVCSVETSSVEQDIDCVLLKISRIVVFRVLF